MKRFLKILAGVVGVFYLIIIVIVTTLLLCYNDYSVTEIFNHSLIIVDDELKPYNKGDLVVVRHNDNSEVEVGNNIFFYEVTNGVPSINLGEVTEVVTISDVESTYTINNNHDISSENFIGKTSTATTYRNLGTILNILESRIGFLVLIVLPTLLLFLYEIYRVIIEIKTPIEMEE